MTPEPLAKAVLIPASMPRMAPCHTVDNDGVIACPYWWKNMNQQALFSATLSEVDEHLQLVGCKPMNPTGCSRIGKNLVIQAHFA